MRSWPAWRIQPPLWPATAPFGPLPFPQVLRHADEGVVREACFLLKNRSASIPFTSRPVLSACLFVPRIGYFWKETILLKRVPGEIDYNARGSFLYAWENVPQREEPRPAPLDKLLTLLPIYSIWETRLKSDVGEILCELAVFDSCRMVCLEESYGGVGAVITIGTKKAARSLWAAVSDWMDRYRFRDRWIGDVALSTLFHHAYHGSLANGWFTSVPPERIQPQVTYPQIQFRPGSVEELDRRKREAVCEIEKQTSENRKLLQFRLGSHKNQELPARWTAMIFAGFTVLQIANIENRPRRKPIDETTIKKAVNAFVERADLRLPDRPFTLATSLAAKGKDSSRSRHNAATKM
jgi:hypothetical protein